MSNKFTLTDAEGVTLLGPDGRELAFAGANGFKQACYASRARMGKGKLLAGPTRDGTSAIASLYSGPLFVQADRPLEPSGESRWQIMGDGSTVPVQSL